jgi:hypothetical protein
MDGRELSRPTEVFLTHVRSIPPTQPPFAFAPSRARWDENAGAIWRGRDGLLLQIGWDPERRPLAESGQLPFLNDSDFPRRWHATCDRDSHILTYTFFSGADKAADKTPGQPPRHTDVWEIKSGRKIVSLPRSESFPVADPTGAWFVSVDQSAGLIKVYKTATGKVVHLVKLDGLPGGAKNLELGWGFNYLLRLHPRGDRLILAHQGILYLWDAAADRALCRGDRPVHFTPVDCVTQSRVTHLAALGGADGVILLRNRIEGSSSGTWSDMPTGFRHSASPPRAIASLPPRKTGP